MQSHTRRHACSHVDADCFIHFFGGLVCLVTCRGFKRTTCYRTTQTSYKLRLWIKEHTRTHTQPNKTNTQQDHKQAQSRDVNAHARRPVNQNTQELQVGPRAKTTTPNTSSWQSQWSQHFRLGSVRHRVSILHRRLPKTLSRRPLLDGLGNLGETPCASIPQKLVTLLHSASATLQHTFPKTSQDTT